MRGQVRVVVAEKEEEKHILDRGAASQERTCSRNEEEARTATIRERTGQCDVRGGRGGETICQRA